MKTVNKYIMSSCVFCYFGGLYLLVTKAGVMRLISQYGIHRFISEWPEDFPSLTVVYTGLIIYTFIFAIITCCIYRVIEKHSVETGKLQQKSAAIHNYADQLASTVSLYSRICRERGIANKSLLQRLQLLQRQVVALPPSVFNDSDVHNTMANLINSLKEVMADLQMSNDENQTTLTTQLGDVIENGIVEIQRLKHQSTTISHT